MTFKQKFARAKRAGELGGERFALKAGHDSEQATDVFGIIEELNIWLMFQEMDSALGVYIREPTPGILINSGRPIGMQRLTAAHELAHHVLGHSDGVTEAISYREPVLPVAGRTYDKAYFDEIEAQAFAMSFLAPVSKVHAILSRLELLHESVLGSAEIYQISLHLGMSYTATVERLISLNLVPVISRTNLLGTKPREIKAETNFGEVAFYSDADVWLIKKHLNGMVINAWERDQFVFVDEEIPSSGYLWSINIRSEEFRKYLDEFHDSRSNRRTAGSIGQRRIGLQLISKGSLKLHFCFGRPWESDNPIGELEIFIKSSRKLGAKLSVRDTITSAILREVS